MPPGPSSTKTTGNRKSGGAAAVARRANVSVMTVSRVFSGSGRVAEATRERILRAANELNYRPNRAASMLRTGQVDTLGYMVTSTDALHGVFHSESIVGFESVLSAHGYNAMLTIPPKATKDFMEWAEELLESGRCGGLGMYLDVINDAILKRLARINGHIVLMNYRLEDTEKDLGLSTVGFSNRAGVSKAVRHLAALGHRRIGYIGGTPGWHDTLQREAGFRDGMQEAGLDIHEEWVRPGDFSKQHACGEMETNNIFSSNSESPTAIICASDEIAVGAMSMARRYRKNIPGDLSIIGFDNHPWSPWTIPPLTTVSHTGWDLGIKTADILLERIRKPDSPVRHEVLDTKLIIRETTAPPPVE